jgi:hypothetical protein
MGVTYSRSRRPGGIDQKGLSLFARTRFPRMTTFVITLCHNTKHGFPNHSALTLKHSDHSAIFGPHTHPRPTEEMEEKGKCQQNSKID